MPNDKPTEAATPNCLAQAPTSDGASTNNTEEPAVTTTAPSELADNDAPPINKPTEAATPNCLAQAPTSDGASTNNTEEPVVTTTAPSELADNDASPIVNPTLAITSYDCFETGVQVVLLKNTELMKKVATKEQFFTVISAYQCMETLQDVVKMLEIAVAASHGFACNTDIKVATKEQFFTVISAYQCMETLQDVVKMLEIAVAASHGFACNTDIVRTLGDYQTLVVDTDIAADAFLCGCMQVLKSYKLAFVFLLKGNLVKTKKMLLSTCEVAGRMEAIAGKLAEKAEKAMKGAQASLNETVALNSKMKACTQAKANVLEKNPEAHVKCCDTDIAATELAVENAAEDRRKQGHVETTDTTSSSSSRSHASEVSRQGERDDCIKALEEQYKVNQAITTIACQLASYHGKGKTCDQAIAALKLIVTALGGIKATFENVRDFWSTLASKLWGADMCCDSLTNEWHEWVALAKVNYAAVQGMKDVKTKVHGVMSDLPNSAEANERLPRLLKELQDMLEANQAHIGHQWTKQQPSAMQSV
ncbi:hypothetical protein SDRG_12453 [Saprolegnia diclina VS20]|uniref:Uncharacterized protein n=1 Tax=Saprolegnia diclina (strain VS20) TaxID=1156394 RepID=T0PWM4_SAPDV|nr:hypothetical protein SDRG_12453 [Saprolegnia diclina VS20]EQC29909.1 hypothetical protein SDRG_12453 [Saprolegnia diclina VS20]|eukprot:XP_008616748.1 hypothetical protein SDRG_12453 [Saprolegnia diclina VS20]